MRPVPARSGALNSHSHGEPLDMDTGLDLTRTRLTPLDRGNWQPGGTGLCSPAQRFGGPEYLVAGYVRDQPRLAIPRTVGYYG